MKWRLLQRARQRLVPPEEDTGADRDEAAATRRQVEQSLHEEYRRTDEVARVAARSRRLRADNNFSLRIAESFRGHRG